MKTNEILKLIGDKAFLDKIYQFSYRRCNTSYEAEDLCSDIILTVISAVHKQEQIENFYAFVWTVARRVYADYCEKRNSVRQTISMENGDYAIAAKENEIDSFIEETAEQEQIRKIFAEISFLSKAYREVMVLYYLDEMKVKDISKKLNISETTVKQRLFFARNTVRKEVEIMNERNLSLKPVSLAFIGTGNPSGNDPRTKAERILSQNLVYACKDKAKSAKELSDELCVPMPYIEDELEIQLKGENGSYGLLRKMGDKYISNVIIVENSEFNEAGKIYTKHLDELCEKLKNHLQSHREEFLNFPYLSRQTDLRFILWTLISESVWHLKERVDEILETEYFKEVNVHVDGSINDPSAENKGWSVEVVIPFSALYEYQKERRAPKNGEFYRMNFSRVQWNVDVKDNTYVKRTDENGNVLPEDNWVWAPTGVINIHYPELWAFVFFSEDREDAPCDSTIPEDEYRKWELRKLYYAENILFETTGSYSSSLDELQKTLDAYAPNDWNKSVKDLGYTIETTSRTYLISCPSADRAHLLLLYSNGKVEKITL